MGFITNKISGFSDLIEITGCIEEPGVTDLVLPRNAVKISAGAFMDCRNITSIIRLDNMPLLEIGGAAFAGCTSLKMVVFPGCLDLRSGDIFKGCTALEHIFCNCVFSGGKIDFEDTAWFRDHCGDFVIIGDTLLEYRGTDTQITVPDRVRFIADEAFDSCKQLESVILQNGVTDIGNYAFAECSSLKTVSLPDTLRYIDSFAFSNCTALEKITIPKGVIHIETNAFYGCDRLSELQMSEKVRRRFHECLNKKDPFAISKDELLPDEELFWDPTDSEQFFGDLDLIP